MRNMMAIVLLLLAACASGTNDAARLATINQSGHQGSTQDRAAGHDMDGQRDGHW